MKYTFRPLAGTAAVLATTTLYFGVALAVPPDSQSWLGSPVEGGAMGRVVRISPGTRWVNVDENEVVRFLVETPSGAQSFGWQFNGARSVFPLSAIAPSGLVSRPINVYVGPDPLEGQMGE
jgi:hypothetical protein